MSYTLVLPIKKKWFDMIASGEKKEEYRDIRFHWCSRIFNWLSPFEIQQFYVRYESFRDAFFYCYGYKHTPRKAIECLYHKGNIEYKNIDKVLLINGYGKNAPRITVRCLGIEIGNAKPEWSDNWQGDVFIIKLGEIL